MKRRLGEWFCLCRLASGGCCHFGDEPDGVLVPGVGSFVLVSKKRPRAGLGLRLWVQGLILHCIGAWGGFACHIIPSKVIDQITEHVIVFHAKSDVYMAALVYCPLLPSRLCCNYESCTNDFAPETCNFLGLNIGLGVLDLLLLVFQTWACRSPRNSHAPVPFWI